MADFDADLLGEMANDAPQAGYGPNVNFGKLTVVPMIISWRDTGEKDANGKAIREPVERPLKGRDKADKDKSEYLRLTFMIDIQEFNPALSFTYERSVDMKVNGPRAKTNWSEIVLPSLIATFGDDWFKKIVKNPYVSVEDADDVNGKTSKKGNMLTAPKFVAVYRNRSECEKAWKAKYGGKANGSSPADEDGIPDAIVGQAKGLLTALNGDVDQAREMFAASDTFKSYDADELIKLATA